MKSTKCLLLIICFGMTANCFGQIKQISREDFYQQSREANKKRFANSRREITQIKDYKDGNTVSTVEFTSEHLVPDKYHYISIEKYSDRTTKFESISINKVQYCRKNDGNWEKSKSYCGYGSGSGGPSNIVETKYTVEETKLNSKKVKLYQEYTTYKNIYSPDKDKEGLSYWQERFWLDKDGFILRKETEKGLIEPRKSNYQEEITNYEYDPRDLKIEAPIN